MLLSRSYPKRSRLLILLVRLCNRSYHLLFLGNASAHISHVRRTKILMRDVQGLADFCEAAPFLFRKGIEQKIKERVEAIKVLRRMTGKFKPKPFSSRGLLSSKRLRKEQLISTTSQIPPIPSKPKKFCQTKKALPKDRLQRAGTMNSIVNPQKGHCFCSSLYTCISCRKFNYKKQCTLYSNSHSASMGSKNLIPPISLDNSCSIGQLCLAVTNWRIDISDPWVLNTIQGYKIDFWVQLIESPSQAPSFLPEVYCTQRFTSF